MGVRSARMRVIGLALVLLTLLLMSSYFAANMKALTVEIHVQQQHLVIFL